MIQHILKMMWNRKRSNFLIILEIFFAFLVLFALFSVGYYNLSNYLRPLGFSYEDVWFVQVTNFGVNNDDEEAQNRILDQLKTAIASLDSTASVARCSSNTPYSNSTWTSHSTESVNGKIIYNLELHYGAADLDFAKVFEIDLVEGRWFDERDQGARLIPIVINQSLKDALYDNADALGEAFKERYQVVGVIQDYRYKGEFYRSLNYYFLPLESAHKMNDTLVIRVRPGVGSEFEERLHKSITSLAKSWTVSIRQVEDMRRVYWRRTLSPVISLGIVAGFLLLNVALGIFGVLWYTITRRRAEIGLRKALGAFASTISFQIIGEALGLTTLGLLLGYFVVVQFPLLNVFNVSGDVYGVAILMASCCMYVLVALCSLYPSRLAAGIKPAVALHEE